MFSMLCHVLLGQMPRRTLNLQLVRIFNISSNNPLCCCKLTKTNISQKKLYKKRIFASDIIWFLPEDRRKIEIIKPKHKHHTP